MWRCSRKEKNFIHDAIAHFRKLTIRSSLSHFMASALGFGYPSPRPRDVSRALKLDSYSLALP